MNTKNVPKVSQVRIRIGTEGGPDKPWHFWMNQIIRWTWSTVKSVKRSKWEDLHSSGGLSFNWEKHHRPSSASDAPPPSILKIAKRISPNGKMYLFKVLNVFVKVGQCISPNGNICSNCKISNHLPSSASVSRPPSSISLLPHFQWFKILLPTKCWIEIMKMKSWRRNKIPIQWIGENDMVFLNLFFCTDTFNILRCPFLNFTHDHTGIKEHFFITK